MRTKLILATDPDREGEAISWHVYQILNRKKALDKVAVERVVFNAVTKEAVLDAMRHPREIDGPLVNAYLARRALDYLVGFTLSPVLWRKLPGARSAGRVQSVALRLVCDREARNRAVQGAGILVARRRACHRSRTRPSSPASRLSTARSSRNSILPMRPPPCASRPRSKAAASSCKPSKASRSAATRRPLHHLDPPAGGLAQARLLSAPYHAARSTAL